MKAENVRATEAGLKALADFANMGDGPDDLQHFQKVHPDFMPSGFIYQAEQFEKMGYREFPIHVVKRILRRVWRGEDHRGRALAWLLGFYQSVGGLPSPIDAKPMIFGPGWMEEILFGETPAERVTRDLEPDDPTARRFGELMREMNTPPVKLNWAKGTLDYVPRMTGRFQDALWRLFQASWRAKVCPQCGSYFVADRTAQRYCSTDCRDIVNRENQLRYWRELGKQRRATRRNRKPKRRHRTKPGSASGAFAGGRPSGKTAKRKER